MQIGLLVRAFVTIKERAKPIAKSLDLRRNLSLQGKRKIGSIHCLNGAKPKFSRRVKRHLLGDEETC